MIKFASTKLASTIKTDHTFITVVVEVHWIPIILQKLFITKILWLDDIIIDSLLMKFSRLKYFLMITNRELFITYSQFFKFLFENFMKAYKVFFLNLPWNFIPSPPQTPSPSPSGISSWLLRHFFYWSHCMLLVLSLCTWV